MINTILQEVLGAKNKGEDGNRGSAGSLLLIGVILFVLLGGLKLLRKEDDPAEA